MQTKAGHPLRPIHARLVAVALAAIGSAARGAAPEPLPIDKGAVAAFQARCLTCHSSAKKEGDLDLEQPLASPAAAVAADADVWERVLENIENGEMPPKKAPPLSADEKRAVEAWVTKALDAIAERTAGDPGPVSLRRLSNMEYTYTVRDLTGIDSLDPVRGLRAQQQGSTNQAAAQGGMSESLLAKYLDAATEVASHAVLLPDGIRFAASAQPQDWINEALRSIRGIYGRSTVKGSGSTTVEQGITLSLGDDGRLALDRYLAALQGGSATGLSPKYLGLLRAALEGGNPSPLFDPLRAKFRAGGLRQADVDPLRNALWRFAQVGHIGKVGGPKAWQEPVNPLGHDAEVRLPLKPAQGGGDVTFYLVAGDAGDGAEGDVALWENPRIVARGKPDVPLGDLRTWARQRAGFARAVVPCLAAVHEHLTSKPRRPAAELAARHGITETQLRPWLALFPDEGAATPEPGIKAEQVLRPLVERKADGFPNWPALKAWQGPNDLSFLVNPTDQDLAVAGTFPARSLIVHPAPTVAAVVSWRSPVTGNVRIEGEVRDLDVGGGNGISWAVRAWNGGRARTLASGRTRQAEPTKFGPFADVAVAPNDVVAVEIDPDGGNHSHDSTLVSLLIADGTRRWDLAKDVVPDILAGNPHADSHGNAAVWHFVGRPIQQAVGGSQPERIPAGSLLASWQAAASQAERTELAARIAALVEKPAAVPADRPDGKLAATLLSIADALPAGSGGDGGVGGEYGLDPGLFGRAPSGAAIAPTSLCMAAPAIVEVRVPASLCGNDAAFVSRVRLLDPAADGSVQTGAVSQRPAAAVGLLDPKTSSASRGGSWTDTNIASRFELPVVVSPTGTRQKRFEAWFDEFRAVFPIALCYPQIVPTDEVVTLMLYHREDEHLRRLILDDSQRAELDRLWAELMFVSEAPLKEVDALEQLIQFATQDGNPKVFEPLRDPYRKKAEEFRRLQSAAEPRHVQAVVDLAARAWRRPLGQADRARLETLYGTLRSEGLDHPGAVRMLIARVLTAPEFLYRGERPAPGGGAVPVTDWELATRLSYFLWSSLPDDELRGLATAGRLRDPEVLSAQARRMLADPRVRRLGAEFGCEYLHVADVATLEEKSETHFPTFKAVRGAMQEEVARFFTDLFQADRSVLSLLDADHTFVNGPLAAHYALPGADPRQTQWRRVDGMKAAGRGGILGFAATQARQAGASRTSPILRGTWVWEVVLGQKLPKPPQGVPQLPEEAPAGLTERQLTERHSSDERCAACHQRIDPFGFALEGFDAIGRGRRQDAAGLPIDTKTALADGTSLAGLDGLRGYLLGSRRDEVVRQFCRKLLMYALGRPLQVSDKPLLDTMVRDLGANDHKVGIAIDRIVRSPQFREVRGREYAASPSNAPRP